MSCDLGFCELFLAIEAFDLRNLLSGCRAVLNSWTWLHDDEMLQLNIGFGHRALHFNIGPHDWIKVAESSVGEAVET